MLASIRGFCDKIGEWFSPAWRFVTTYAADLIYFVGMVVMCYGFSPAWRFVTTYAADLIYFVGMVVMCYGFSAAWEPLGPIVFGGMICLPMLIHRMRGTHA